MSGSAQLGSLVLGSCLLGGENPDCYELEEALRRWLLDRLADLYGGVDVFYMRRPQFIKELPCVVIEKDDDAERAEYLDGTIAEPSTIGFRFILITTDPAQLTAIAKRIKGTKADPGLDGFGGMMLGHEITSAVFDGESDAAAPPDDDSDVWTYGRNSNYKLTVRDA